MSNFKFRPQGPFSSSSVPPKYPRTFSTSTYSSRSYSYSKSVPIFTAAERQTVNNYNRAVNTLPPSASLSSVVRSFRFRQSRRLKKKRRNMNYDNADAEPSHLDSQIMRGNRTQGAQQNRGFQIQNPQRQPVVVSHNQNVYQRNVPKPRRGRYYFPWSGKYERFSLSLPPLHEDKMLATDSIQRNKSFSDSGHGGSSGSGSWNFDALKDALDEVVVIPNHPLRIQPRISEELAFSPWNSSHFQYFEGIPPHSYLNLKQRENNAQNKNLNYTTTGNDLLSLSQEDLPSTSGGMQNLQRIIRPPQVKNSSSSLAKTSVPLPTSIAPALINNDLVQMDAYFNHKKKKNESVPSILAQLDPMRFILNKILIIAAAAGEKFEKLTEADILFVVRHRDYMNDKDLADLCPSGVRYQRNESQECVVEDIRNLRRFIHRCISEGNL